MTQQMRYCREAAEAAVAIIGVTAPDLQGSIVVEEMTEGWPWTPDGLRFRLSNRLAEVRVEDDHDGYSVCLRDDQGLFVGEDRYTWETPSVLMGGIVAAHLTDRLFGNVDSGGPRAPGCLRDIARWEMTEWESASRERQAIDGKDDPDASTIRNETGQSLRDEFVDRALHLAIILAEQIRSRDVADSKSSRSTGPVRRLTEVDSVASGERSIEISIDHQGVATLVLRQKGRLLRSVFSTHFASELMGALVAHLVLCDLEAEMPKGLSRTGQSVWFPIGFCRGH